MLTFDVNFFNSMSIKSEKAKRSAANRSLPSLEVKLAGELMAFLLENLKGKSRDNIKSLLKHKQVQVNGIVQTQFNFALNAGDLVEFGAEKIAVEKDCPGLTIMYEDAHIIVIDKHSGVLAISDEADKTLTAFKILSTHVKRGHPDNKLFVVHRLDRDTSGVMMFAKSPRIQKWLQDNWQEVVTERTYLALVEGEVKEPKGRISSYLKESSALMVYSSQDPSQGQLAITRYEVFRQSKLHSLLKVYLETGRKNQIRVHLKEIDHSIVGDKKYGATTNPIGRLGLHAWVLAFVHPVTQKPLRFETNIPRKFLRLF
jgi:23S rRNA pseudouridine1911/1915/1917 synthase